MTSETFLIRHTGILLSHLDIFFIKTQAKSATWLASNCSGVFLLGEAGLAKAYPNIKVQYDQNFVVDDNVITSNGL